MHFGFELRAPNSCALQCDVESSCVLTNVVSIVLSLAHVECVRFRLHQYGSRYCKQQQTNKPLLLNF